jgi:hypothetical protein
MAQLQLYVAATITLLLPYENYNIATLIGEELREFKVVIIDHQSTSLFSILIACSIGMLMVKIGGKNSYMLCIMY